MNKESKAGGKRLSMSLEQVENARAGLDAPLRLSAHYHSTDWGPRMGRNISRLVSPVVSLSASLHLSPASEAGVWGLLLEAVSAGWWRLQRERKQSFAGLWAPEHIMHTESLQKERLLTGRP